MRYDVLGNPCGLLHIYYFYWCWCCYHCRCCHFRRCCCQCRYCLNTSGVVVASDIVAVVSAAFFVLLLLFLLLMLLLLVMRMLMQMVQIAMVIIWMFELQRTTKNNNGMELWGAGNSGKGYKKTDRQAKQGVRSRCLGDQRACFSDMSRATPHIQNRL